MAAKKKKFRLLESGDWFDRIEIPVKVGDKRCFGESRLYHEVPEPADITLDELLKVWQLTNERFTYYVNYGFDLDVRGDVTAANTDEGQVAKKRLEVVIYMAQHPDECKDAVVEIAKLVNSPKEANKAILRYWDEFCSPTE